MINNNRQAGRRRGRGGQQQRPQGNSGRQDTGNRIDNRSRGNAAQLLEKYKALARDSQMSGDRVNTEYYLQFADHYFRVLAETRSRLEENNRPPIQGGANTFQDDEQDYDDEGEPVARAEPPRQQQDGNRQDGRQEGRQDGRQETRQDGHRPEGRQDRPERQDRQDGNRQERNGQPNGGYQGERQSEGTRGSQNDRPERQDRQASGERAERQYDERPRRQNTNRDGNANGNAAAATDGTGAASNDQAADRYVREDRGNRNRADRPERTERYQAEERATVEQEALPLEQAPRADTPQDEAPRVEEPQEAPRRRGRPRREPVAEAAPAFEADRLPPSLNISAVTPVEPPKDGPANDVAGDEPEEKPRRRRGRPPASEVTGA
ncbi:DUF4167 domain-containing protein [Sphingomonas sp. PB4P5]|uniref:DUF4167 domain-containing protein n=1 Tax=Parasphingomonas puruogangriensis TaxID=3096155 RepID=UPI002FC73FF9